MLDSVDGGVITRMPTGASFVQRFKQPYIVIHRVDLHRILLDACRRARNIEMMPTHRCRLSRTGRPRAAAHHGRPTIEGAALIGADGLRSTVRQQMLDEGEPRTIGYVAHRTIVPMADVTRRRAARQRRAVVGPGFHIVHYPLRDGTLFNIVAVFKTSTRRAGDTARYRAELEHAYRECASDHEGAAGR